ncbi:MAG TPA: hypothetical protein IAA94_08135 [Candidatus Galloscillospira stercoripullorum]|nr:hypothetical protein [Candidatus Galloscillospira stercoripullorum]
MNKYIFALGEFSDSNFLELRKACNIKDHKLTRPDSLYVIDDAFFFFLEAIFREVVEDFDMFEDTYISKSQWQRIMKLNLKEIVDPNDFNIVMQILSDINDWVEVHIDDACGFIVIGV